MPVVWYEVVIIPSVINLVALFIWYIVHIYNMQFAYQKILQLTYIYRHVHYNLQVAYQKILQLSYIDKFLSDIQLEFRNKYKDDLLQGKITQNFDFNSLFNDILKEREEETKQEAKSGRLVHVYLVFCVMFNLYQTSLIFFWLHWSFHLLLDQTTFYRTKQ